MAIYMWREFVMPDYLCFTANTAGSTVALNKTGSPTAVTLETSTDGVTRTDYTIWTTITLSNIWDKVYMRNKSETATGFSTTSSNTYNFAMSWKIAASGDVNYLLCKNSTDTLIGDHCLRNLFYWCTSLTTPPSLTATTLTNLCYVQMFYNCTNLEKLPKLPATTLTNNCYNAMFQYCSKIKISTTQTWEYQNTYRIPTTWTWTSWTNSLANMFNGTWWTFIWQPSINTTYYTSNTVI